MSARNNQTVKDELEKMLHVGIVTPSSSDWNFRVVIVSEKDGNNNLLVDYCALNQRIKDNRCNFLKIQERFDDLKGRRILSTWIYSEEVKENTTFVCRFGTFQLEVMLFGLINARTSSSE